MTTPQPLVSCIMPTRDRRAFVPRALRCFARQDYAPLELVIVDDGDDAIADCLPADARLRYLRVPAGLSLGAKRNLACAEARGELIAHWDDDDWYPPTRVRRQVAGLLDGSADVTGSSHGYFYDAAADRAWRYQPVGIAGWVLGTTLAYTRDCWRARPFDDVSVGEDNLFLRRRRARLRDLADPSLVVAALHAGNRGGKTVGPPHWRPEPSAVVHALAGDDLMPR